jgi:1-acyl-sn-glycerol-3-phosphate acyltransferase
LQRARGASTASLVLARLIPGVRIYTTLAAGASRRDQRSFLVANAVAIGLWLAMTTTVGLLVGVPAARALSSAESLVLSGGLFVVLGVACYQAAAHSRGEAQSSNAGMLGGLPVGTRVLLAAVVDAGICLTLAVGSSRVYRFLAIRLPIHIRLPLLPDGAYDLILLVLVGGLVYLLVSRGSRRGVTTGERLFATSYRRRTTPGAKVEGRDPDRFAQFPIQTRATLSYRVLRGVVGLAVRLLFRVSVRGKELIPPDNAVIVANHLGWIDAVVLLLAFPSEPRVHILGEILGLSSRTQAFIRRVGGIIPIDRAQRDDRGLRTHIEHCLQAGGSLVLFPEGRFGYGEHQPAAFRKGFAHFAKETGVPIIPVALAGTGDLWLRRRLRVHIGAALSPGDHDVEELVAITEARVRALLPPVSRDRGPQLLRRRLTNLFL